VSVFDDLVGQEAVVQQLRSAASGVGNSMTHAWLFTGPPGSGRSVAARAFAAALQCADQGCGHCEDCHQVLRGTHADVAVIVPEGLSLGVKEVRRIVEHSSRQPSRGHWQVTLIEDADRMQDYATNALLKAIEEPPPHGVILLCAPSVDDLLPTIRSRCRLVPLRTPPAGSVARVLVERDGVDPSMAAFAARAAQGHIGRARRLATEESARAERREGLSLPRQLGTVGHALAAAKDLVDAAKEQATAVASARDEVEREALFTALGGGATGKGYAGSAPKGGAGALKELEKQQKARGTRTQRDALDRSLLDLAAFYRDVLSLQLSTGAALVHTDLTEQAGVIAGRTTAESTIQRIDAILACRVAIDGNVAPLLAVEAMALALR
jgi:DNA polymerase III delta' subunit